MSILQTVTFMSNIFCRRPCFSDW